jgi:flagellar motility protein MotE (MotC chaperone)
MKVRLLPITITTATLMLALQVHSLYTNSTRLVDEILVKPAIAEDNEKEDSEKKDSDSDEDKGKAKKSKDGKAAKDPKAAPEPEKCPAGCEEITPGMKPEMDLSETEVSLLQSLSRRKVDLESQVKKLEIEEAELAEEEKRVEQKLSQLKALESDVDGLIKRYEEKEKQKIVSLVKIYENMKPKDAAAIFEKLDMEVLLKVINAMSERKVSPILANLSPERAQEVTLEIARQGRFEDEEKSPPMPAPLPN